MVRTRRVTTVWSAALYAHPRRFVNKYRPDLYHPELHIVRFSATVEPTAPKPKQEGKCKASS